jgi:membrane protein DedA with SNARE-associated domain
MAGILPRIENLQTTRLTRPVLLTGAAVRAVLAIIAIPLAPMLYREHVAVLVLLRPTKEVFLFSGFAVREGDAWLPVIVLAALPILLVGVWIFYALGREYGDDLADKDLPGLAGRILPKKRIDEMRDLLEERGPSVVFFGRLAAFPSTLMAAAAGASGVARLEFLLADTAGALVSMGALLGVGYVLGETYETAGPWVTAVGAVVLVALFVTLGRALLRSGSGGTATRKT